MMKSLCLLVAMCSAAMAAEPRSVAPSLTPEQARIALVLISRADIKGQEARTVVDVQSALSAIIQQGK